jgi:hypothetical protein
MKTAYSHIPEESLGLSKPKTLTKKLSLFQRYTTGWRFGVLSSAVLAVVVFAINLFITLGVLAKQKPGPDGRLVLYTGSCQKVAKLDSASHILINLLGTLLLSSSNYCMQCLSAPTRTDVDYAHSGRVWLDIGVPSFRNLRYIGSQRVILWSLLALSSLPLHLL